MNLGGQTFCPEQLRVMLTLEAPTRLLGAGGRVDVSLIFHSGFWNGPHCCRSWGGLYPHHPPTRPWEGLVGPEAAPSGTGAPICRVDGRSHPR